MQLPPCGLYRTTAAIGAIEERRLVYFHNHGDPGPGLYVPTEWKYNRAQFSPKGQVLDDPQLIRFLRPLPAEGLYRVVDAFHCCEKECRRFEPETLLQLGYNGNAEPILFVPELVDSMLGIPAKGWMTSLDALDHLRQLKIPVTKRDATATQ